MAPTNYARAATTSVQQLRPCSNYVRAECQKELFGALEGALLLKAFSNENLSENSGENMPTMPGEDPAQGPAVLW